MPKVERITEKSNYAKIIYLDDDTFFKVSNKADSRYKLAVNKEIENFDEILNFFIIPAIKHKINDLLKRKDYSESELYKRLYDYGYSSEYVMPVLEKYKKIGFIDDENYCTELIHKYSFKYGHYMIRKKILDKGIANSVFDKCYSIFIEENENCACKPIYDFLKRYDKKELMDYTSRKKIKNRLIYRGFTFEEIDDAINKILTE